MVHLQGNIFALLSINVEARVKTFKKLVRLLTNFLHNIYDEVERTPMLSEHEINYLCIFSKTISLMDRNVIWLCTMDGLVVYDGSSDELQRLHVSY